MKAALVIMAAGLGSRYGGNKQVDGVGPQGEMLMEYSIYDAVRAGFTKVVFIIKPDMRELMDRLWGDRTLITKTGEPLEVCYAMQDFTSIPDYYTIPEGRTKPFGTAHAVLCARPYLSEPFCVINADDYYGVDAYRAMYEELQRLPRQGLKRMFLHAAKLAFRHPLTDQAIELFAHSAIYLFSGQHPFIGVEYIDDRLFLQRQSFAGCLIDFRLHGLSLLSCGGQTEPTTPKHKRRPPP